MTADKKYQAAISFAAEQRAYADKLARQLQQWGIEVFYAPFEQAHLWGKDGIAEFQKIFGNLSRFVVMLISENYVRKMWPRVEYRAALHSMFATRQNSILPVQLDGAKLPGLPKGTLYLDGTKHTPAEIASILLEKLGIALFSKKASQVSPPQKADLQGQVSFDYSNHNGIHAIGSGPLEFETKWSGANNNSIHVYNDPASIHGIALAEGRKSISQVKNAKSLDYTSRSRTPRLGEIVVFRNQKGFYAAIQILGIKARSHGADKDEVIFRYAIQSNGSDDFSEFKDWEQGEGLKAASNA